MPIDSYLCHVYSKNSKKSFLVVGSMNKRLRESVLSLAEQDARNCAESYERDILQQLHDLEDEICLNPAN